MPQPRKHASNAQRQAAYRERLRTRAEDLALPVAVGPTSMPSSARWRCALDQATRLLQTVAIEMQDYSDQRSERWHEGESAERFHETLDQLTELLEQANHIRSSF